MNTITIKDGSSIFYKDWGKGQPIVFSHGWPLSGDAWGEQLMFFAAEQAHPSFLAAPASRHVTNVRRASWSLSGAVATQVGRGPPR